MLDAGYETLNKILNFAYLQQCNIKAAACPKQKEKIKLKNLEEFLYIVIQYINIIYNINIHLPVTLLGTPVQLLVNVNI